jgi:micrococcal nuclease
MARTRAHHLRILVALWGILILGTTEAKTVLQVIDGDTCLLADGRRVRYLGIDAPEKGDPQFEEATRANNKLVGGKEIRLELGNPRQDRDGRLLAYVFVDNDFVNEELVRQGYAHIRRPLAAKYRELFLNAQEEARTAGLGIWAKAPGRNITIATVHADAAGDDRQNLNDEFIVIKNQGNTPVDFTGWTILDESNHRYLFPSFTLPPKAKVTLRTGFGKNTQREIFWGSRRPIWNNNGDTIFLRDAEGSLILSYVY